MTKKKLEKDQFIFEEGDEGVSGDSRHGAGVPWGADSKGKDDSDSGGAGGSGGRKPPDDADPHKAAFHEASVRGQLRGQEEKFGKVLAETNIDIIFTKLLEKLNTMEGAEQQAALEASQGLAAHPLLDSQAFDGMEADLNLNPEAIDDPAQRQELRNRLQAKLEQKLRLQQKLGLSAPRPQNP
jgi:hypothetical protein